MPFDVRLDLNCIQLQIRLIVFRHRSDGDLGDQICRGFLMARRSSELREVAASAALLVRPRPLRAPSRVVGGEVAGIREPEERPHHRQTGADDAETDLDVGPYLDVGRII